MYLSVCYSGMTTMGMDDILCASFYTLTRLASTGAARKFLAENPGEFDPRKFLIPTMTAMKGIVKDRLEAFGCAGQVSNIGKVYSLEEMADEYGL